MTFDIDGFCRHYLDQWDRRATVRTRQRTRFTGQSSAREMFPAALAPVLAHPEVARLGEAAGRELLVLLAYDFQKGVATIEADLVAGLCSGLAGAEMGIALPDSLRDVALTIATDELYHAYVAREFVGDVERHTGIVPTPVGPGDQTIMRAVAYVRDNAPAAIRRQAETMALCFAENTITEELFGMSRDTADDGPFHTVVREHLVDEGRHQIFFQRLMRHLWAEVDEETRRALGRLMPGFFDIFLFSGGAYMDRQAIQLGRLGFDSEAARRIVAEAFTPPAGMPAPTRSTWRFAQRPMDLVQTAGIADHPPTRALLVDAGWIATA